MLHRMSLIDYGISVEQVFRNISPAKLYEDAVAFDEALITSTGAIATARARAKKHEQQERRNFSRSRYQRRQSMLDMSRASIPHSSRIVYPDNWDAVKSRAE